MCPAARQARGAAGPAGPGARRVGPRPAGQAGSFFVVFVADSAGAVIATVAVNAASTHHRAAVRTFIVTSPRRGTIAHPNANRTSWVTAIARRRNRRTRAEHWW